MRLFLLVFVASMTLAHADPLPSLIWTTPGVDDSMSMNGECISFNTTCVVNVDTFRDFTVTSPGAFSITDSVSTEFQALICEPDFCNTSSFLTASFTLSSSFVGSGFSGSGSAGPSPASLVILDLDQTNSTQVTLPVGDYTFDESFLATVTGSGDTSFDYSGTFSLTPTPEPKSYVTVLIVGFVVLVLKRHRTTVN